MTKLVLSRPQTAKAAAGCLLTLFGATAATVSTTLAQQVHTRDGRVLVGPIEKSGSEISVQTLDGEVTIEATDVTRLRERAELHAELRRLAKRHGKSPFAQLELARTAREWGLYPAMWRHLDACLEGCPGEGATRRRVETLLGSLERELLPAKLRNAPAEAKVRALIQRARPEHPARVRATEKVIAATDAPDAMLRKLARRGGSPTKRLVAIRALAERGGTANERFVFRSAVIDESKDVRAAAMRSIPAQRQPEATVQYLHPGLYSTNPKIARRTAEAFATLGDASAIPHLARAGAAVAAAGLQGGATRGYVAVIRQDSYIRDFDVEVAQAAFIADPKVDVVQSGVVLDATAHAVTTTRTTVRKYRKILKKLAGTDPGAEPRAWPGWLATVQGFQRFREETLGVSQEK